MKVTAMSVKHLLRFLPFFLILSFFLYVLSELYASYLYACFVNISIYMLTEILNRLSNLFYGNSFIFVDVNIDVDIDMHGDLVICNNFINYKVLPAFDFHFLSLESSQLLQTDITLERKCSNNYCFSLALFIFPIMFARVFFRNKHKRVKAFFVCIIFLLSIKKPNLLLTKNDIFKSPSQINIYESIDACNLLHTSHLHNAFAFFPLSKFPSLNYYCYLRVISV